MVLPARDLKQIVSELYAVRYKFCRWRFHVKNHGGMLIALQYEVICGLPTPHQRALVDQRLLSINNATRRGFRRC